MEYFLFITENKPYDLIRQSWRSKDKLSIFQCVHGVLVGKNWVRV